MEDVLLRVFYGGLPKIMIKLQVYLTINSTEIYKIRIGPIINIKLIVSMIDFDIFENICGSTFRYVQEWFYNIK